MSNDDRSPTPIEREVAPEADLNQQSEPIPPAAVENGTPETLTTRAPATPPAAANPDQGKDLLSHAVDLMGRALLVALAIFSKLDVTPVVVKDNLKDQVIWRRVLAAVIDGVILFCFFKFANSLKFGDHNLSILLNPQLFVYDALSVITPLITIKVLIVANNAVSTVQEITGVSGLAGFDWMIFSCIFPAVVILLYHSLMESSPWQGSLGKKICGVVVTDLAGKRVSFGRALKRNAAKAIAWLPYTVIKIATDQSPLTLPPMIYDGLTWIGFAGCGIAIASLNKQCLHDAVADTLVQSEVRKETAKPARPKAPRPVPEPVQPRQAPPAPPKPSAPVQAAHANPAPSAPSVANSPAPHVVSEESVSSDSSGNRIPDDMRECPACAELIKKKAVKCRYCQERFA